MGRGFSVPYRFQSLLVAFHCLCLAASTLGRGVPHHRTQDPKKPGVLRRRSLGIFPQLPGLSYQLLNSCASRILLPHGIREKAHARQYPDLGIDEIRILLRRSLEFVYSLLQIFLQLGRVNLVVEPIDRAAPKGKPAPVLHPSRQFLVLCKGRELSIKAFERNSISFIVRSL